MINGEMENVAALPFEEWMNVSDYAEKAGAAFMSMPEGSIILFDLFSGTPFNQIMTLCSSLKIYGLCGASLPMLLDALMFRESMKGTELVKAVESSAHDSIVNTEEFLEKAMQTVNG
jgi:PTS system mannose-specific IIA component/D-glucosaminate-specific PTS system IIA component